MINYILQGAESLFTHHPKYVQQLDPQCIQNKYIFQIIVTVSTDRIQFFKRPTKHGTLEHLMAQKKGNVGPSRMFFKLPLSFPPFCG